MGTFLNYLSQDPLQESQRPGSLLVLIVLLVTIGMLWELGREATVRLKTQTTPPLGGTPIPGVLMRGVRQVGFQLLLTDAALLGTVVTIDNWNWLAAWVCAVAGLASIIMAVWFAWYVYDQLWYKWHYPCNIGLIAICLFSTDAYLLFGLESYVTGGKRAATWLWCDLGHWLIWFYDWITFAALVVVTPLAVWWFYRERMRFNRGRELLSKPIKKAGT